MLCTFIPYERFLNSFFTVRFKEPNIFVYSIVNEFSLEEFKKFTNFRDIIKNILDKRSQNKLEKYIELNFNKNIPKEQLWREGAFSSLKLTVEFYQSKTATRLFRNIYGIRKCQVKLVPIEVEVSSIIQNQVDHVQLTEMDRSVGTEV